MQAWKLKEPELRQAFDAKVGETLADGVKDESDVEMAWQGLKECLLEVAGEVCGTTKGKQRLSESWW